MANFLSTLQSLVKEKVSVRRREQELLSTLNRVLPSFGYKIVPAERNGAERSMTPRPAAARSLQCPHCDRRFAQPLHLGRHVAATHRRERQGSREAASRTKSARGRTKKAA
jgi:hypothetical protein